jgi:hypothetical protein
MARKKRTPRYRWRLPASVLDAIREKLEDDAALGEVTQSYIIAMRLAQSYGIDVQAAIDAHEPCAYIPHYRLSLRYRGPRPTRH